MVRDEFQVFSWDGRKRGVESWNRDQTLRDSMRNSTVWVYQMFARQIGEAREQEYLRRIAYGNADSSGGIDRFWLDGGLRISALEQVAFLQRLYRNDLPFPVEHQRLVKDMMIIEAGPDYVLRAKTGWGARTEGQLGWWVGWVERAEGAVFFALNIDMPNGGADVPKRQAIARAILESINALPINVWLPSLDDATPLDAAQGALASDTGARRQTKGGAAKTGRGHSSETPQGLSWGGLELPHRFA